MAPSIRHMADLLNANHWKKLNDFHKNTVARVVRIPLADQHLVTDFDSMTIVNLYLKYEIEKEES